MREILKVEKAEKIYGNPDNITTALDQISFSVCEGEFVGIMGASGSGKTTLLNCISTIDRVTSGHISIRGEDITEIKSKALSKFRRDEIGFIFQEFNLLDTMTAFENIILPLTIAGVHPKKAIGRVNAIANKLNINEVLNKYPYQMSGGQRQRVAAARAIITDPAIILADEPTGALDSKSSRVLLENMVGMNESLGITVLMVTHDTFAASYCKRILFIKDGKIFNEIFKGELPRREFFHKIIKVISLMGGDTSNVF